MVTYSQFPGSVLYHFWDWLKNRDFSYPLLAFNAPVTGVLIGELSHRLVRKKTRNGVATWWWKCLMIRLAVSNFNMTITTFPWIWAGLEFKLRVLVNWIPVVKSARLTLFNLYFLIFLMLVISPRPPNWSLSNLIDGELTSFGFSIAQSEVWSWRIAQWIAESKRKNDFTFWPIFGLSPNIGLSESLGKLLVSELFWGCEGGSKRSLSLQIQLHKIQHGGKMDLLIIEKESCLIISLPNTKNA